MFPSGKRLRLGEETSTSDNSSGASSGQALTFGRNPMMKTSVLTRFFEYCKLTDLLKYRLVSKKWYSVSLGRIRNEAFVKISSAGPARELNWISFEKEFNVVGEPFKCFHTFEMDFVPPPSLYSQTEKSPSVTCTSSSIKYLSKKTGKTVEEINKNMDKFWVQYGQSIHKLNLEYCTVFSMEAFRNVIFQATPNLGELTLDFLKTEDGSGPEKIWKFGGFRDSGPEKLGEFPERNWELERMRSNLRSLSVRFWKGPFPLEWQHLFLHFPKLQKLELAFVNIDDDEELEIDENEHALNLLHDACESLEKVPINELLLQLINPTWAQATALTNLLSLRQVKLTKLKLGLFGCDARIERKIIFQTAMRMQGDTLNELNLKSSLGYNLAYDELEPNNNFPFRTGTFEHLTVLDVSATVCANFQFLPHTPNLRVLRAHGKIGRPLGDGYVDLGLEKVRNVLTPLVSLKEFHFNATSLREKEMELLLKLLPNVEIFKGLISKSALPLICNNWKNLRQFQASCFARQWHVELASMKNITVLPYLKDFSLGVNPPLTREDMEVLVKVMPNVEKFSGWIDSSGLRVVYDNWNKLKELHIFSKKFDDEALTGIKVDVGEPGPNIAVLQDLQRLTIESGNQFGESTIWNGFLKLPHLHYINVRLSEETSQEAIAALCDQISEPGARIDVGGTNIIGEVVAAEERDRLATRFPEKFRFKNISW